MSKRSCPQPLAFANSPALTTSLLDKCFPNRWRVVMPAAKKSSTAKKSSHKESRKEKQRAQVQSQSLKVGGARNARIQGRQTEIRQRPKGHKPKAGYRHRTFRGAQVRRKDASTPEQVGVRLEFSMICSGRKTALARHSPLARTTRLSDAELGFPRHRSKQPFEESLLPSLGA